ncbi:MAG: hypothetical protein V3R66_05665 [Rhodospirillales bacterium]
MASLVGYSISSKTGVEPGFFEAAEAGSYGAGASDGDGGGAGMEQDMQEYYKKLLSE